MAKQERERDGERGLWIEMGCSGTDGSGWSGLKAAGYKARVLGDKDYSESDAMEQ